MGEHDAARVDVGALRSAARRYEAAAELVDATVRTHLRTLTFDGADAGRDHASQGAALRRAVDDITGQLRQWSHSAMEIAELLHVSADRYVDADAGAGRRVG